MSNRPSNSFCNSLVNSTTTARHYSHQATSTPANTTTTAYADSGCTGHFLRSTSPCVNKIATKHGIPVRLPNGTIIRSTHTAELDMPHLPLAARQAHIFPDLANSALLSIGQFCDNGYEARFTKHSVTIQQGATIILQGQRDPNGLWVLDLETATTTTQPPTRHAHNKSTMSMNSSISEP